MFEYLRQYNVHDMRQMLRNGKLPPDATEERLDGRLCVITGTTHGVGLAAARRLSAYGADLLMINRNPERTERLVAELCETATGSVDFLIADFADLSQTARAARQLLDREREVDVLINNAGVHMTTRQLTIDGHETAFAVNHLSPFLLTRALLPRMLEGGRGRVIQVNSQGHRFFGLDLSDLDWARRPYIGVRAYGAAKTAQLLCTWEFAEQAAGRSVTVNASHPGSVKTNVGNNNGSLYRWFKRTFIQPTLDDVAISGVALHYLAAAPEMEGSNGRYYNLTHDEKPAPHALDRALGKRIWDVSCTLTDRFLTP